MKRKTYKPVPSYFGSHFIFHRQASEDIQLISQISNILKKSVSIVDVENGVQDEFQTAIGSCNIN